jgi:hypothetical protein
VKLPVKLPVTLPFLFYRAALAFSGRENPVKNRKVELSEENI